MAENGERVRVAFALDCCDREAMSFVATTAGIMGKEVRDLMVAAFEHRFGRVNQVPTLIEWLTDDAAAISPANPPLRPRHWLGAEDDAPGKRSKQRHG